MTTWTKEQINQFSSDLANFTGTEKWTRWNPLVPSYLLTDGALYVANQAGAYWLMDLIASYNAHEAAAAEWLQAWKLTVNPDRSWLIICEDGNNNELLRQEGELTDFPP